VVDILFLFSLHLCADCAPREVQRILEAIQEAEPLARHRAQGGRIMCVQEGCEAPYAEPALARVLPDALFRLSFFSLHQHARLLCTSDGVCGIVYV
jgi:hypothetical protein